MDWFKGTIRLHNSWILLICRISPEGCHLLSHAVAPHWKRWALHPWRLGVEACLAPSRNGAAHSRIVWIILKSRFWRVVWDRLGLKISNSEKQHACLGLKSKDWSKQKFGIVLWYKSKIPRVMHWWLEMNNVPWCHFWGWNMFNLKTTPG